MAMFKQSDVEVSGRRVLVKQWTGEHFNWVCLAEFRHVSGVAQEPEELARAFAKLICY